MFLIKVIDDDKIEVRARGHFARTKPTQSDHRALPAADLTVGDGKFGLYPSMHDIEQHIRQPGESLASLLG